MTAVRLTDAQIAAALREHLPAHARSDVRDRVAAEVARTPQLRPLRGTLARLADADPAARRRMLLLVAAVLLALGVAVALTVGALVNRNDGPIPIALDPPEDVAALVRSAYGAVSDLPPLTLTAVESDGRWWRIYVSAAGAVRMEQYPTPAATQAESYEILSGRSRGHLLSFKGEPVWFAQEEAIEEDPRVSVYARLAAPSYGWSQPQCQTMASSDGSDVEFVGTGYEWLGGALILDRATHHVRCVGELWIDDATRLVLRSQGARLDEAQRPIEGAVRTIEVTELLFGALPADLFELRPPDGARVIDDEDYGCATDPYCLATPRPIVTPSPAPHASLVPRDVEELIAATQPAADALGPFEIVVSMSNTKYPSANTQRSLHDGSGRYRHEFGRGGQPPDVVTLVTAEATHSSRLIGADRSVWDAYPPDGAQTFPLVAYESCESGWEQTGVDLVANRVADRITCGETGPAYWIDRELGFLLRTQSAADPRFGSQIQEVVSVRFDPQLDPALFELPPGAEVVEQN